MPLTPKDIEQQTFRASFRGYAEDEVDMFLEEVILSIGDYQQMVRERDARLADGGAAPAGAGDGAAAREEASRIVAAARADAETIIADATLEAARLIDEAGATAGDAGERAVEDDAPSALTEAEHADRDRLLKGYRTLKDELDGVRARLARALTASDEAFDIVGGQVSDIIEAAVEATPIEAVADPEPAIEFEQESEPTEEAGEPEASEESEGEAEDDLAPPRRPWER